MNKIDFKKEMGDLYSSKKKDIFFIKVPEIKFIMIDGKGNPNISKEFQKAVEVLFGLSYTLKFMIKKKYEKDYSVMPLEGLWWVDNMDNFSIDKKDDWKWTIMIMQPEFISDILFIEAVNNFKEKKKIENLDFVRFEKFNEGLSAQIIHTGPFSEEGETVQRLHDKIRIEGYHIIGKHHEIYLNDFRRTKPEKLKTIIRQPILK